MSSTPMLRAGIIETKKVDMSDMSDTFWSRSQKLDIFAISEQTCHDTMQKWTRFPPHPITLRLHLMINYFEYNHTHLLHSRPPNNLPSFAIHLDILLYKTRGAK
jgi:hypothetical protein